MKLGWGDTLTSDVEVLLNFLLLGKVFVEEELDFCEIRPSWDAESVVGNVSIVTINSGNRFGL